MGTMELGSVPTPPKNPKSWTRIQSARQSTAPTITPMRTDRRLPLRKQVPTPTRRTTTAALTSQPCPAWNEPNERTHEAVTEGWDTRDISRTMPVRVPGGPDPGARPDQKPRPGHACRTPMPTKKAPIPRRSPLPSRGVSHDESGRATRAPATT